MIISHKHKFIFIHIPKCAGSTIGNVIRNYYGYDRTLSNADKKDFIHFRSYEQEGNSTDLDQHDEYTKLKIYFDKQNLNIGEYFLFTFVRNPWARRVSQYEYARRVWINNKDKNPKPNYPFEWSEEIFNMTFKEYLKSINDLQLNWISKKIIKHWEQEKHDVMVDFIGTHENIHKDFNIICDKIGIPKQELPHKNATKHKCYTEYYDEETKQMIANKCAKDIEHFGYEFGK